jgi:hypothetical protein
MIVRVMIMEREFKNDEFCGKKSLISVNAVDTVRILHSKYGIYLKSTRMFISRTTLIRSFTIKM